VPLHRQLEVGRTTNNNNNIMAGIFTYRNFSLRDTPALDGKVAVITVSGVLISSFLRTSSIQDMLNLSQNLCLLMSQTYYHYYLLTCWYIEVCTTVLMYLCIYTGRSSGYRKRQGGPIHSDVSMSPPRMGVVRHSVKLSKSCLFHALMDVLLATELGVL
jgi:hypothetical protein